jgi:hypothetical protein
MTTQLAPTPIFKAFDNAGLPLAFGFLYTYQAGTTTPQATYTDSTGGTPNPNPIQLNARGEAQIWLNPLQNYKFLLTDALGNQIPGWPVDNISGSLYPSQSIIPNTDNAYDLGSLTDRWRNGYFGTQLYVGANNLPVLNASGNIGYWKQTPQEATAGIVPANTGYPYGWIERYGADPTGVGDSGPAFRTACSLMSSAGGGTIYALGQLYVFNTWDATSFYAANNLALFRLPANTELAGGGMFFTKLRISQAARTGMYANGANRTHIIGMAKATGGQYVHDLQFDYDGIVQAAANDYCYFVRTCAANCIIERCYGVQAPITNAIVDNSTDTANGNSPLGPTVVRDCWFADCGPNMTGNSAINGDLSYLYLTAPGSRAERNRLYNSAIANHNCGGIEMHSAQYYAVGNYIKNCWPGMYLGVADGATISVGSRVERNYIGYCLGGIEIIDQHTGLRIINNHFEANDDSAGAGAGHDFTDIYTPLNSTTGVNSAGVQTDLRISGNTFDQTLYRQGTARATAGTAAAISTSINLSVLTGLSIDHNDFIAAMPACIQIVGSVTGAAQSVSIEENNFLNCMDIAGTTAYVMIYPPSSAGWVSGPAVRDCFVRRNHLWRSSSYAISNTGLGLAYAGGAGPAATLTNVQFEDNDCDNVAASIETSALTGQGQVSLNGADQDNFSLTANGQTIPTSFPAIAVNSAGAYTGLILEKGGQDGQLVTVINVNASAQTMAVSGTSNVANGTACVIPASSSMRFIWNAGVSLWYPNS